MCLFHALPLKPEVCGIDEEREVQRGQATQPCSLPKPVLLSLPSNASQTICEKDQFVLLFKFQVCCSDTFIKYNENKIIEKFTHTYKI